MIPNIERKYMMELEKNMINILIIHKDEDDFSLIGTNEYKGNHHGKIHAKFDQGGKISVDSRGNKFQDLFSKL